MTTTTNEILTRLKARRAELQGELKQVEKAIDALAPETSAKPKARAAELPERTPITERHVLEVLQTDGGACSAERVALKLAADSTRVAAILSKAFGKGIITREGERGGYE